MGRDRMHGFIARPRFTRPFDDEEERRVLAELVPICKRSGGFRALYTLRVSEREIVNIFFWDTREEAERGFAAARPHILELLGGILEGPPDRVSGGLIFSYPGDPGPTEGETFRR
jgi:hypothetical protein